MRKQSTVWHSYDWGVHFETSRELTAQEIEDITRRLYAQLEDDPTLYAVDIVTQDEKTGETSPAAMVQYATLAWETLETTRNRDRSINENILLAILTGMIQKIEEVSK